MARWTFEPGHTAAEFRARHMMVSYVRGAFKNVHGTLEFDPESPRLSSVQATIEATGIWTGEPKRDAHLRSPDFLDVEKFPQITFKGDKVGSDTSVSGKHPGGKRREANGSTRDRGCERALWRPLRSIVMTSV